MKTMTIHLTVPEAELLLHIIREHKNKCFTAGLHGQYGFAPTKAMEKKILGEYEATLSAVETSPAKPVPSPNGLYSTLNCSAFVRCLYDGHMVTCAVTHVTPKCMRVINTELGVAYIPLHIVRWSDQAFQFCVTDEEWEMDFTKDVAQGMDAFPIKMDVDVLLDIIDSITK